MLFRAALALFMVIMAVSPALAHLDAGEDRKSGSYIVDFGYSPKSPGSGESVIMAFNLLNSTTNDIIVPDSVWVRVSIGDDVLFAGTLHPEAMHIAFSYVFPEKGDYEVTSRFRINGDVVAEEIFHVNVSGADELFSSAYLIVVIVIAFEVAALWIRSSRKLPKKGDKA